MNTPRQRPVQYSSGSSFMYLPYTIYVSLINKDEFHTLKNGGFIKTVIVPVRLTLPFNFQ